MYEITQCNSNHRRASLLDIKYKPTSNKTGINIGMFLYALEVSREYEITLNIALSKTDSWKSNNQTNIKYLDTLNETPK